MTLKVSYKADTRAELAVNKLTNELRKLGAVWRLRVPFWGNDRLRIQRLGSNPKGVRSYRDWASVHIRVHNRNENPNQAVIVVTPLDIKWAHGLTELFETLIEQGLTYPIEMEV